MRGSATGKLSLLLNLNFFNANRSARKILCLGAHCDDIEIGCGGTILRWLQANAGLEFYWIVLSSNRERKKEASKSAEPRLAERCDG